MAAERLHAALSRADLLWCLEVVPDGQQLQLAAWLGFEPEERHTEEPSQQAKLFLQIDEPQTISEVSITPKVERGSISDKPAFYRVKYREPELDFSPSPSQDKLTLPDWFTQAKATFLKENATRVPSIHRVLPVYPPLIPWSRLWPFLQRILGSEVPGSQPDLNKIVKQVAQGEQLRRLPKRSRYTWAPRARVLIDINDSNFPYRQDFLRLRQQLLAWRGEDGLQLEFIADEPGGMVASYQDGQERLLPWCVLPQELPFLILSDLGCHSGSRHQIYQWLAFGQQFEIQGERPTVLMPVAERDIPKALLRYFNCVSWDDVSRLRPVQGDTKVQTDAVETCIEQLLAICFPAVRVDLGLLRAVRRFFSGCDVGYEAAVWRHAAVNRADDEWGWQANSRIAYLPEFLKVFESLPLVKRQRLVELIGCHHAQLPDELYFEAMDEMLRLGPPVSEVIPSEVKTATDEFMAMLVKTYAEHSEHQGLDLWVKRYLARHDDPAMRRSSDQQLAFMAYERQRSHPDDARSIEWPSDLDPSQILPYLNIQQARHRYLLRQKGAALELITEAAALMQTGDFGEQALTLLSLDLLDTTIFHRFQSSDGKPRLRSIDLASTLAESFTLPIGQAHQLQIGRETITLEALPLGEMPLWIAGRGTDQHGTFVTTRDRQGQTFRWYWHPPGLGQIEDSPNPSAENKWQTYPGFWYYLPPSADLKPNWAEFADRDHYGLFADVNIAGVVQRFRWIPPGSFQMGSPSSEDGRNDDETQHQVNLSHGYWLADTACTQALWQALMRRNPSKFKGETRPVNRVSWNDVKQFLNTLNMHYPTLGLRLPTEAEWEYTCRVGTVGAFNFNGELTLDKVNYLGTWDDLDKWGEAALQQSAEVKSYPPNPWGLYEMHGNVLEWCQDWYGYYPRETVTDPQGSGTGDRRVLRGGSWFSHGKDCRCASRSRGAPDRASYNFGFRLARGHESSQDGAGQQPSRTHTSVARGRASGDGLQAAGGKQNSNKPGKQTQGLLNNIKDWFKK